MLYDLHMHSCLSPCAEDDMTPANIAGLAKLAGAELIAVTDHNAADNLPAVQCCCNAYGLRLLPGVEVNTAEEIHVLCYFKTVDTALEFGRLLYAALPEFPYDPAVWGRQLVMDENDEVLEDLPFAAVELHDASRLGGLVEKGLLPAGLEVLSSSDAHRMEDVACSLHALAADSVLRRLL